MAMAEPFTASTAAGIAVNGGATTMSQCVAAATSGRNEEKNARVSASVLYIFQLPAITRRRMRPSREDKDNAETPRPGRGRRRAQSIRREEGLSFIGKGFDAGELASAEKFERSSAAGGEVRDLVRRRSFSRISPRTDRKSTRLNSSHQIISYAVFCLKKKKSNTNGL